MILVDVVRKFVDSKVFPGGEVGTRDLRLVKIEVKVVIVQQWTF